MTNFEGFPAALNKKRFVILLALLLFELFLACYLVLLEKRSVILGFLVKVGNQYLVAWKEQPHDYLYQSFGSLKEAIHFSRNTLKLREGQSFVSEIELERVWVQDRFGTFVVFWKTSQISMLHQLSFQCQEEALFFAEAFRKGSYTPSPFGHSVLLLPQG